VYQVAAHVLTTTPAGDVTFVGKFVESFQSVTHGGLMGRQGRTRACRILIVVSIRCLIRRRILLLSWPLLGTTSVHLHKSSSWIISRTMIELGQLLLIPVRVAEGRVESSIVLVKGLEFAVQAHKSNGRQQVHPVRPKLSCNLETFYSSKIAFCCCHIKKYVLFLSNRYTIASTAIEVTNSQIETGTIQTTLLIYPFVQPLLDALSKSSTLNISTPSLVRTSQT
jgi:hypothetical protein